MKGQGGGQKTQCANLDGCHCNGHVWPPEQSVMKLPSHALDCMAAGVLASCAEQHGGITYSNAGSRVVAAVGGGGDRGGGGFVSGSVTRALCSIHVEGTLLPPPAAGAFVHPLVTSAIAEERCVQVDLLC